jgi:hypothetical protein
MKGLVAVDKRLRKYGKAGVSKERKMRSLTAIRDTRKKRERV